MGCRWRSGHLCLAASSWKTANCAAIGSGWHLICRRKPHVMNGGRQPILVPVKRCGVAGNHISNYALCIFSTASSNRDRLTPACNVAMLRMARVLAMLAVMFTEVAKRCTAGRWCFGGTTFTTNDSPQARTMGQKRDGFVLTMCRLCCT